MRCGDAGMDGARVDKAVAARLARHGAKLGVSVGHQSKWLGCSKSALVAAQMGTL